MLPSVMVIRGSSRKSNTDGLMVAAVAAEALGRGAA